jgi:UDP-GlcNAc:undecaprenyl-phosphate/decaprenyl-phosphate GlcNAc-1-phosphate transferase
MPVRELIFTTLIAFALSAALARIAISAGIRLGLADAPGGRRKHARLTSRFGVLPLFGGFTLTVLIAQNFAIPTTDPNERIRLTGMLLGGVIAFGMALVDDKFELRAAPQFALQALAALPPMLGLIFIERFRGPGGQEIVLPEALPVLGTALVYGITLFWFLGMINTVNFMDGVDGVAASVALVAAITILVHMLGAGQYSVAVLPAALIGTLFGFLVFNVQPARLFLGGGALYLGFVLACIGIIAGAKVALLLLVLGLPVADVAWQIVDRIRQGRSPTSGDRGHLHLRLFDRGWAPRKIVTLYAGVCGMFGAAALLPVPPIAKLLTFAALFLVVILTLRRISHDQS